MAQNAHPPSNVSGESPCEASGGDRPELRLTSSGDGPDRRLLDLVCLLARRAARQAYERQTRESGVTDFR